MEVMQHLEERMRQWVRKGIDVKVMHMLPSNAAEMLGFHGDKKLAGKIRQREGEITLVRLENHFFEVGEEIPKQEEFFKLVCFWTLKDGVRILGVSGKSKDDVKEKAQKIKSLKNTEEVMEDLKMVSWIGNQMVWETKAEVLKDQIQQKVLEVYEGFDRVQLPELDERGQKKILIEWIAQRKRGGIQFQKNRCDLGWMKGDAKSCLHLITKFLTIFSFDYEELEGEFYVRDQLGRRWPMSRLEVDRKTGLVQMTLCLSYERCVALLVEKDILKI